MYLIIPSSGPFNTTPLTVTEVPVICCLAFAIGICAKLGAPIIRNKNKESKVFFINMLLLY
jgi:hypothetical protein